jgi:ABC-type Zn2+ transport system substrate-binding protein/surface adhesin
MKTAMQWLQERYNNNINLTIEDFKEALEKEKEQITKAYKDHHDIGHIFGLDTEQYFNQTYNN